MMRKREKGSSNLDGPLFSEYDSKKKQKSSSKKNALGLALVIIWISLILIISLFLHFRLPSVRSEKPEHFSENRAKEYVRHISEEIGPRVVGTRNENLTGEYILKKLYEIQEEAKKVGSKVFLEIETQDTSGLHRFDLAGKITLKMYTNLTNVIARVSCGAVCERDAAILINTHFDSSPGTPGAMDTATPIGVMIEMIRNLMYRPKTRHSAIFLFNGAEESLQDASHGFITQHRWRNLIRSVVNLEACGSSGKAILFQAGEGSMIEAFAKAPFPLSTVSANEIFSTGVILSDTDYRQFVQYGQISGLDIAYYQNSYLYHTSRDSFKHIAPGSIQHMGENAIEVVYYFLSSDILDRESLYSGEKVVYFDFFGQFLIYYSWNLAQVLHYLLFGWTIYTISVNLPGGVKNLPHLLKTLLFIFLSFLGGLILPALFGAIMAFGLNQKMPWFSREYLPFIYFFPVNLFGTLSLHLVFEKRVNQEKFSFLAALLFLGLLILLTTLTGIMTSYFFSIWIFFLNLAFLVQNIAQVPESKILWITYFIGFTFPLLYTIDLQASLFELLIPLTGRMGFFAPADVVVGLVTGLPCFFFFILFLPLAQRNALLPRVTQVIGVLAIFTTLYVTLACFPYDDLHPKRIIIQHFQDTQADKSYILLGRMDYVPFGKVIDAVQPFSIHPIEKDQNQYSDFWESAYPMNFFLSSLRFEAEEIRVPSHPNGLPPMKMEIEENWDPETQIRNLTLHVDYKGYHWTVLRFEASVLSWSIPDVEPEPQYENNRYVLRQVGGYQKTKWTFWMSVKGHSKISFDLLGIVHENTELVERIRIALPPWADTAFCLTVSSQSFLL